MNQYYLFINNQRLGPFDMSQLVANGMVADTLVWRTGMPSWMRAADVPELASFFPAQQTQYRQPQYAQPQYQQPQYAQPQYQQQGYQQGYQQQYQQGYQQPLIRPQVGFGEAISICFKKYVDFSGRARRSEYWWFMLFCLLLGLVTCGIGLLAVIIPMYAVQVRRLHDTNRSGWWVAANLILSLVFAGLYIATISSLLGTAVHFYGNDSAMFRALITQGSGWFVGLSVLSLVGTILSIVIFVFTLLDSDRGTNQYGPSPKYP